jgi:hypothetical protein
MSTVSSNGTALQLITARTRALHSRGAADGRRRIEPHRVSGLRGRFSRISCAGRSDAYDRTKNPAAGT